MKQNRKLVDKCKFSLLRRGADYVKLFDLSCQTEVCGLRFQKSRFLFGLLGGAPRKSVTGPRSIRTLRTVETYNHGSPNLLFVLTFRGIGFRIKGMVWELAGCGRVYMISVLGIRV